MSEIANAVIDYAHGYWSCTGWDIYSHVVLGIGTSNGFSSTVINSTYAHGSAWAQMIFTANNLLSQTSYSSQVSVAGASDMELGFNTPGNTRSWVDGYDSVVFNPVTGIAFNLYSIGDAAGCYPYYGQCGTPTYSWSQEDLWYISYGCHSCYPLPMIYSEWKHAEQWLYLSKYAKQTHGFKIMFKGTTTQYKACSQRPNDVTCPTNEANLGYQQLFTVLNSDPETSITQADLKWSTDMKWLGE